MINLLPNDVRQEVLYARRNRLLFRWSAGMVIAIIGIIGIIFAGQLYLSQLSKTYERQVASEQEQIKTQKLDETQAQAEEISTNLKLVVQVLSREVLFSQLLKRVGAVMPPGAALAGLNINKLQGGIDLTAVAIDYQSATQVHVNLQDPSNQIFEKVDLISAECDPTDKTSYPCKINLRAAFTTNNPFLFISSSTPPQTGVSQ